MPKTLTLVPFSVLWQCCFVRQILTGIWLTMNYVSLVRVRLLLLNTSCVMWNTVTALYALDWRFCVLLVHYLPAYVPWSNLRFLQKPRELLCRIFGMLIFLVLMAEAFMGYLLPWGQMSYWGAQVIISLFGAISYW